MDLTLLYPNSEEGRNTALMFKYVMNNNKNPDIHMEMVNNDKFNVELLVEPARRIIKGDEHVTAYDNIRSALKSIFPQLIDPERIKKKPLGRTKFYTGPSVRTWVNYNDGARKSNKKKK